MSRIDPYSVVVLVRDNHGNNVRIGVCSWKVLREDVRRVHADDESRFKEIETQVGKAMQTGIASS